MNRLILTWMLVLITSAAFGANLSTIQPDTKPATKITIADTNENTAETEVEGAIDEIYGLISGLGGGHAAVTLSALLDSNLFSLSTQELGLDTQTANYVFAGPASGAAAAPAFRALTADDIPSLAYEPAGITESDISDFGTYLTAETDPTALKAADIGTTIQAYSANMDTDSTDDFTWDFDYGDLINTPTIPSGNAIIDWTTDQGAVNIHSGNYTDTNTTYSATDFDIKDLTDSTSLRSTWNGKQDALGFTPENHANLRTTFQATPDDTHYASEKLVKDSLDGKAASSHAHTGSTLSSIDISDDTNLAGTANEIVLTGDTLSIHADIARDSELSGFVSLSTGRIPGLSQYYNFSIAAPSTFYAIDAQLCIDKAVPADITITRIEITCDADPTTEIDADLKWADAFIGLANATTIEPVDTTAGVVDITSGIDDATIASGKCIYLQLNAAPDAAITQIKVKITYDFD